MKTIRLQKRIITYLRDGDKNTTQIVDHINKTWKHGTRYHAMGNILAKSKPFIKKGVIKKINNTGGSKYNIAVWGLKPGV